MFLKTAPCKKKSPENGKGFGISFGANSINGWRKTMEDEYIAIIEPFPGDDHSEIGIFGVFDGHGGSHIAKFTKMNFLQTLKKNSNYLSRKFNEALEETFMSIDRLIQTPKGASEVSKYLKEQSKSPNDIVGGCTANVIIIYKGKVYCANAGDSRAVVYSEKSYIPLSIDHKPEDTVESERIYKAGGFVVDGRINGGLNLSRAFGDFDYKKKTGLSEMEQMISPFPEIRNYELSKKDLFIVMGCDGIWETFSDEEIGEFFKSKMNREAVISSVIGQFLDESCAENPRGICF